MRGWLAIGVGTVVALAAAASPIQARPVAIHQQAPASPSGSTALPSPSLRIEAVPAWVTELGPVDPPAAGSADSPVQFLAVDEQFYFGDDYVETYSFIRSRVQTQAGLAQLGRVSIEWDPARETVSAHRVLIIRDGQVINVLERQTFEVLRRETNLEAAMLDGWLTASLQISDLRVGDILETAFTVRDTGGVLAPHREQVVNPDYASPVSRYRLLASWPVERSVMLQAPPWGDIPPRRRGDRWEYMLDVENLQPVFRPLNLPHRFYYGRVLQFTDYESWDDLRRQMAPLYETAAELEPESPLNSEIERIRAAHATDLDRAAAALRLVQDEVRYLALSIGDAGYVPVAADDVWRSRFGDCKGKTALLLALLRGLGIEAEPALVSLSGGDGLNERAPLVGWFDHVIVRTVIDGQVYWIDGTGTGDRRLADLPAPPYGWALVLNDQTGDLEPIERSAARIPTVDTLVEIDATAGLDAEAPFRLENSFTGTTALVMRDAVSRLSREQLQSQLGLSGEDRIMRVNSVDSSYDDDANRFTLLFEGVTRMSWVRGATGRALSLAEVAIQPAYAEAREGILAEWADQPYVLAHPIQTRVTARVRLPQSGEGFRLEANDRELTAGGVRYQRRTTLIDGWVESVATMTSLTHEVTAAEMSEARQQASRNLDRPPQVLAPASAVVGSSAPASASLDEEARLARAEGLAGVGDLPGALEVVDGLIDEDPGNADALRLRAGLRADLFEVAGAIEDYERLLELDPADSDALNGIGLLSLEEGRPADAVISFTVALRLAPSDLTSLTGRAAAYYRIGNLERALADARAAKAIEGGQQAGLAGELRALIRLGRLNEARDIATQTLGQTPLDGVALNSLIEIDAAAGAPQEALPSLDHALQEVPDDPLLLTQRGGVRARSGDLEGARADFGRVRELGQGTPWIMSGLCWRQAIVGLDLEQALADCDAAMAGIDNSARIARAFVLLRLDRKDEALGLWEELAEDRPSRAVIAYGRGLTRLALGDPEGRADLDQAAKWDPDVGDPFRPFITSRPDLAQLATQ